MKIKKKLGAANNLISDEDTQDKKSGADNNLKSAEDTQAERWLGEAYGLYKKILKELLIGDINKTTTNFNLCIFYKQKLGIDD